MRRSNVVTKQYDTVPVSGECTSIKLYRVYLATVCIIRRQRYGRYKYFAPVSENSIIFDTPKRCFDVLLAHYDMIHMESAKMLRLLGVSLIASAMASFSPWVRCIERVVCLQSTRRPMKLIEFDALCRQRRRRSSCGLPRKWPKRGMTRPWPALMLLTELLSTQSTAL